MKVTLKNKDTGEVIERHAVDARELLASGEWETVEGAEAQAEAGTTKVKKPKGKGKK